MLPIIFRRRSSRSAYRPASYQSYRRRNTGRRRTGCVVPTILLMLLAALWCLWYYYPLTEKEIQSGRIQIQTETRYVIADDTTDIMAFTSTRGDTLLEGLGRTTRDTVNALWVRPWELLPYNGRRIAVESKDTATVCRLRHDEIMRLLRRQARHLTQELHTAKNRLEDVDYFLHTHTVLDNGFDIVARYGERLSNTKASLSKASGQIEQAMGSKSLRIRMERRFFIPGDSTGTRIECEPKEESKGLVIIAPKEQCDGPGLMERLYKKGKALNLLKATHPRHPRPKTSAIDSTGNYCGGRDSTARPHGYGTLLTLNGDYYEGEWIHGKRNGVGFSIIKGQRLQLGEWKDDKFLGERITYTPERIYGIDISKHQHEKGRRRYSINWKDLRITSLGKMSKKIIHGEVNYPVRFVFIKATEGVTVRNRYFAADYAAARRHGYRTGAYHFYSWKTSGHRQAMNFLRNSRYAIGDLPPVLDLEPTDAQIRKSGGIRALFNNVRQWLNTVEQRRGVRPILYISQRFVNKYLHLAPDLQKKYDVWIARYGEYKPNVNLKYWQLSPDGRVKGIHGEVDINVYNGLKF